MHQQTRVPPRLSSPTSSPQVNQGRTSTAREAALGARPRAGSSVSGRESLNSPTAETPSFSNLPAESIKKLDQIVQNFYTKAAILVLDSRIKVKITRNANGMRKTNKWFQIETDEIDDFRDELKVWKSCGSLDNRPPPMIIEVYLDTSSLKESQSLVVIDDDGKRWDVMEQLNASGLSSSSNSPISTNRNTEVVLERWRIELKTTGSGPSEDFGTILPTIYKKAIVFFRTLFLTTRLLPAWKFASQSAAKNSHPALTPRCRIRMSEPARSAPDRLRHSIDGRRDPVTEYMFGDLDVPVGRLSASVTYRNDCSFRIDDAESLLSSRGRLSVGSATKGGDEEQTSSGRQSLASSVAQPGSGLLAEAGQASSGSIHAEEDDIEDFLKALDSKKTLKSFEPTKRGDSATNKTVAQLSKFHMMRESNNALGDSMTSSMQMHRSSSSSSRQLTSVPGMVAPASVSTSTSPGKPVSPHTPHTPAIPSRLSENSIIDYGTAGRIVSRSGRRQIATVPEPSRESTITQEGTTAIDIPLSPRLDSYQRRSSSVAQQTRALVEDEDNDLAFAAHRSISLGADDREPPTMSTLLGRQMQLEGNSAVRDSVPSGLQPAAEIQPTDSTEVMQGGSAEDNPPDSLIPSVQSSSPFPRRRYAGLQAAAARQTPPQSSRGSFTGSLSRLGRADEESEPLVFDLSEMDAHGRRSLEEARGGSASASEQHDWVLVCEEANRNEATTRELPAMFRTAATGPFDEVVGKATDENLTSEDWGAIIEVCDKVSGDQNGPKEAVQSMIKRLAHRNANVQLYTLELAHALCQNCGKPMHREVSSRAFTDALLKLANDRNTHTQVKAKILEKMKDWSDMFSQDSELGIMYDAYYRLKQSNPTLQAPSAPQKQGLTQSDRQKEEDELQMALKLSLQEEERKKATPAGSSSQAGASGQQDSTPTPVVSSGTTAATVSRVRALYDFVPSEAGELEFKKGDVIAVLESVYKDWWRGSLKGKTGIFPLNYVEKLTDPTPDELQREAQMEAEVFAEIKNVEKLLTLLSASNTGPREEDNEEISKLYHQTLAIRPKLIKLIEKYSQKKDDFTQLNEKFIKARRDYEALLESSMAHPPQHNYHQYAMRPAPPGQGYGSGGAGYPGQGQPPQDPQGFYGQGPAGDHPQQPPFHQTASPPPNFQPPGQPQGTPAPFYVAGSEVPSQSQGGAPQQYPPREHSPRLNSHGKQPTSPPPQTYTPYSQPPTQAQPNPYSQPPPGQQRPQSTYGAQELATSVYDSPIAPHNPGFAPQHPGPGYSQEDLHAHAATAPSNPYSQPPPQQQQQQQQQYQSYNPPDQAPPPVPAGQPPQAPLGSSMSPPPLQPHGAAYDSRHGLPSQAAGGEQPQYKPYVPPGDGPSAPNPSDYYR
ncbi:Class E vacuolar protein-sorting machinery protein hse1 [Purpureocillium lavendulum]|uniref:Autophagy-related protein 13 n=1 Tax=Purpureocillium lavendulum TaxID=1247861 RepID=A0AB34FRP1_9HYPO|nr:Class E vacuolar protein-sorting machinery protein hse1 [Purpureocillium lavendulum]